jgi:monoamine oxidase
MAHTPLLKSLVQLAREHHRAAAAGLPVEALREADRRRRECLLQERGKLGPVSRRGFIGAGATLAGGALLPRASFAQARPRIAIVGAGIAGLAAALKLTDNGVACTVYEANARLGGRIYSNTDYFDQGQVFEWCGELIDSGHTRMRALAGRFGLALDDLLGAEPSGSTETYYFSGQYYPKAQADRDFKDIQQLLRQDLRDAGPSTTVFESTAQGRWLNRISVYDWIELRVPGGHASPLGALLDTAYYIELNSDTREQAALNLIYLLGYQPNWSQLSMFGISDEKYRVRGGNQQIPIAIANRLGSSVVRTGMQLQALRRLSGGAYELRFDQGGTTTLVEADQVLITTPFAVLRTLDTSAAGFDTIKQHAIQNLGAGRQSKQHLQFTRRVWNDLGQKPARGNGSSYADTGYQASWEASRAQAGSSGILVGYAGGTFADAMKSNVAFATADSSKVRQDAQRFLAQAEPVFPGLTSLWNGRSTQGLPHLDPNMKCSYSYFKVGQYETIAGYERVRQGNVFFAGEHCSFDFQGFMEGGAREGERAALEMMAAAGIAAVA